MKKIIIATFALLGVISVQAQKNSILLGTDFSYSRANGFNDEKTNEFTFSPVIAYEVAENWFVGAKTSLSYSEASSPDTSLATSATNRRKDYSSKIGGFVRYYHPFSEIFGVYADLGAGYQQYRSNTVLRNNLNGENIPYPNLRYRESGYYIDFVPALFVNFKNNFGLNISFGGVEWNDTKGNTAANYADPNKSRSFDLTFGKAISVGVTKKFSF